MSPGTDFESRRRFLKFLAGTPLLAATGVDRSQFLQLIGSAPGDQARALAIAQDAIQAPVITSARQALSVFDFERAAAKKQIPAHWGFLQTGTDDDGTIEANREGFARWGFRVRRLVDLTVMDPSTTMLGTKYATPLVLCPVGNQLAFHPEGDIAVARAARTQNHLHILSTLSNASIEAATAARGGPVWMQLYFQPRWTDTKRIIERAERAGSPALVVTVDLLGGTHRETYLRAQRADPRNCGRCHQGGKRFESLLNRFGVRDTRRLPNVDGFAQESVAVQERMPTWDLMKRLRDSTSLKLYVKGIVTAEDAQLALQHGADGLFVSNHGGRAENSLRSAIECLPEVLATVKGKVPVEVDGGVRRGTDVFKALALGATTVGIGRPFVWGLGAFGQEGVETVLGLLRRELLIVMRQAGCTTISAITRDRLVPR